MKRRFNSVHPEVDGILNRAEESGELPSSNEIVALGSEHPIVQRSLFVAGAAGKTDVEALSLAVKALARQSAALAAENARLKQSMRTRMIGHGLRQRLTPGPGPSEVA